MLISIHPLRGEWDCVRGLFPCRFVNFNPPTPWGVGHTRWLFALSGTNFNPPTPWGVGPLASRASKTDWIISIHPLRGEWDTRFYTAIDQYDDFNPPTPWGVGLRPVTRHGRLPTFQSTHSVGSGTFGRPRRPKARNISIHPLRGEWDQVRFTARIRQRHFNPPTPWGVGQDAHDGLLAVTRFQSTHSVGSGTGRIT